MIQYTIQYAIQYIGTTMHDTYSDLVTLLHFYTIWVGREAGYPDLICHNRFIIIIAMPSPLCMSPIDNLELTMSETCLPEQ